jgi:hypothetical protein
MDLGHVEPGRVRRDDDLVSLCGEVLAGLVFNALPVGFKLGRIFIVILLAGLCLLFGALCHFDIGRFLLAALAVSF